MYRKMFSKTRFFLPLLLLLLALFLTGRTLITEPGAFAFLQPISYIQQSSDASRLLNGKTASLSWIFGHDCQLGIQAYLQSSKNNPDAAVLGTAWVNPLDGSLANGHNNCMSNSGSMDNVVQLVHSKGGMAYLTITMDTGGSADSWSTQQGASYIAHASRDKSYIDPIVHEVVRGHYDGVIMDLEGVDANYPSVQQIFATYNQRVWAALQPLHKLYGITLIHKLSDHDDYYSLNGFENWRLLAHAADFIVIMAVDQSYLTPGPTVGMAWLNQLLAYTLQNMPQMLPHIIWELPLYGNTWHWENGGWVFDGDVTFQDAQSLVDQLSPSQIDAGATYLQDVYGPHVVYTDSSGVKHSLWYLNGKSLYNIVAGFWQSLQREPQFANTHLQIAVWWRTTWEPQDFWPQLDKLY